MDRPGLTRHAASIRNVAQITTADRRQRLLVRRRSIARCCLIYKRAQRHKMPHRAGMVQKGAVTCAADGLVAAEAEGNVRDAAADLAPRAQPLDLPRRPAYEATPLVMVCHPHVLWPGLIALQPSALMLTKSFTLRLYELDGGTQAG